MPETKGGWSSRDFSVELDVELTDKQIEALLVAHRLGYHDGPPRGAHTGDVADALDLTDGTASRRIRGAEGRLMREFVDELMGKFGCPLCREPLVETDGRDGSRVSLRTHLPECPERDLGLDPEEARPTP